MNDYNISVVIPNYNNAKYITECIESVERQTYPIAKVIVVDDCSKDNSLEILYKLEEKYSNLHIIALKENGGVSHARNTGLASVKTPYVTFLDSDDIYFNSDKIKNEMELIRKHKKQFSKDVITYSKICNLTNDGVPCEGYGYKYKYYNQGSLFKKILTEKYFFTIMRDYCVSTEVLKNAGGYDENSCLWEDLDLILELSKNNEFYYTGDSGTGYRQTPSGLSSKPKEMHMSRKKEIFERHTDDIPKIKKIILRILKFVHKYENKSIIFHLRAKRKVKKMMKRL